MDQKVHTSSLLLSTIVSYNSFFSTLPVNLTTQILRNLTTQSIAIIYACNFQKKACDSGTSPHQPELPKTFPSTRRSQKYSHVLPLNYTEMWETKWLLTFWRTFKSSSLPLQTAWRRFKYSSYSRICMHNNNNKKNQWLNKQHNFKETVNRGHNLLDGKFNGLFKVHFKGTNKFTSLRAKPKKNSNCLNITCGLILFRGLTLRSIKSAEYFLQITQNGVGHEHRSDSWSTTNFPFFRKSLV